MKKTLAILLALALVLCMMPAAAFAAESIESASVTLSNYEYYYDGTDKQPEVTSVTCGNTLLNKGGDYTVSYSDNRAAGTAKVIISGMGAYSGAKEVTFTIYAVDLSKAEISLSASSAVYNGTNLTPTVTVKSGGATIPSSDYTVSWNTSDSSTGLVDAGTYTATISPSGSNCSNTATASFKISPFDWSSVSFGIDKQTSALPSTEAELEAKVHYYVNGVEATGVTRSFLTTYTKATLSGSTVSFTVDNAASGYNSNNFTGSFSNSSVNVETATAIDASTLEYRNSNGTTMSSNVINGGTYDGYARDVKNLFKIYDATTKTYLTLDTDYIVSCADTVSAGSHTVTITGRGKYAGTKTLTLSIAQKDASKVSIASIGKQSSTTAATVEPVVTDYVGGKTVTLVAGKDYDLSAVQDTSTSTKKQKTLTFKGNYTGTRTVSYEVVAPEYDVARFGYTMSSSYTPIYNGKAQTPSVSVYTDWKKTSIVSPSYYTIAYRYTDKNGKAASTTAPKDAYTYDVYIEGRSPYAGELKVGTYTIKQYDFKDIKVTATQASATSIPVVTVTSYFGDITFVKDADYTVSHYGSYTSGNGYVYISSDGKGNLTAGSTSATYTIAAKSLYACTASFTNGRSSSAYTGSAIKPAVTVRDGYYTTLKEGTDYTISYKDAAGKVVSSMKDAGTYTVVITGKGNYSGTLTLTYTIIGIDISGYTVTLKANSVNADGYSKVPTIVSVKYGVTSSLLSSDYTVSYQDSTGKTVTSMSTPGTYKVVVTGKNGYSGSTYATFRIVGIPQTISIAKTAYKVYPTTEPFRITASASGDGTGFSYVSNNPSVATVDKYGNVTIHKIGRAVITVTTTGMKKSDPASDEVYVKVHPLKTTLTQKPWNVSGKKGTVQVRWNKQDEVTKYQIMYCRNSSFKAGTYSVKTVNASTLPYTTQSTKITGLQSGYRYYFKVRAVKEVYNENGVKLTYYGKWANWRSVVVK